MNVETKPERRTHNFVRVCDPAGFGDDETQGRCFASEPEALASSPLVALGVVCEVGIAIKDDDLAPKLKVPFIDQSEAERP